MTVDVTVANVDGGVVILGTGVLDDLDRVTIVDTELDEKLADIDVDAPVALELAELDLLVALLIVDDALVERMVAVGVELFAVAPEELADTDGELVLLPVLLAVAATLDGPPVVGRPLGGIPVEGLYPYDERLVEWSLPGSVRTTGGNPGGGRTTGGTTAGGGGTVGGLYPGGGRPGGGLDPGDGRLLGVSYPGDRTEVVPLCSEGWTLVGVTYPEDCIEVGVLYSGVELAACVLYRRNERVVEAEVLFPDMDVELLPTGDGGAADADGANVYSGGAKVVPFAVADLLAELAGVGAPDPYEGVAIVVPLAEPVLLAELADVDEACPYEGMANVVPFVLPV